MALNRLHESTSINNHSGPDIKPLKRTNLSSVTHTDSSRVPRKQRRLNSFHEGISENEFDYDLPSAEDIFDPKTHNRLSTATGVFTKRSHQAHTPSKFPSFDSGQGGGLTADAEDIEIDVSGFANNRSNFSNIQMYSASVFKSASPQHKLKSGAVSSERDIDTSPASSPSSITPAKALSAKEEMLQFLNQCRTNLLHSMKNQKTTPPDPQAKLQLSLSSSSPELSTKMETTACSFSEHQPEDAESNEFSKKICAPDLFANIFE
ncbi:hypothetical protein BKA69DRAFT_491732 [Paraphysoderma sedebokerense]|nr:hypothetical protein BKA69DRAFT_491732 [Paraphysoderma sedebokerense]